MQRSWYSVVPNPAIDDGETHGQISFWHTMHTSLGKLEHYSWWSAHREKDFAKIGEKSACFWVRRAFALYSGLKEVVSTMQFLLVLLNIRDVQNTSNNRATAPTRIRGPFNDTLYYCFSCICRSEAKRKTQRAGKGFERAEDDGKG